MFDSPGAHKPKRSPSICSTSTSPCNSDPWVVGPLFNHMLLGCNYLSCCRSPWMVQGIHCRPDRSSRHPRFFQGVCKPRKTAHRWLWEKTGMSVHKCRFETPVRSTLTCRDSAQNLTSHLLQRRFSCWHVCSALCSPRKPQLWQAWWGVNTPLLGMFQGESQICFFMLFPICLQQSFYRLCHTVVFNSTKRQHDDYFLIFITVMHLYISFEEGKGAVTSKSGQAL